MHRVGVVDAEDAVLFGVTVIVPVVFTTPQPPIKNTVYVNVPATDGLPEIVTILLAQVPVTPDGKPITIAPVAPVVFNVIVVIGVFMQVVLLTPASTVLFGVTVIVPVALTLPHPPVKGIV